MGREDLPYYDQADTWRTAMLENHLNGNPDNFGDPRFVDPLEPELEEAWQQITISTQEADTSTIPAMAKIWNDTSINQAIRDRALIVGLGSWKAKRLLGFDSIRGSMGGDQFEINDELKDEFNIWCMQAIDNQHSTGLELLAPSTYLSWVVSFFVAGDINQEQFEEYLNSVDIDQAKRQYGNAPHWALESPRFEGNLLDYSRFPLLSDIFFNFYGNRKTSAKIHNWALNKFEHWVARKLDPSLPTSSPEWLDWEDERQAFWLSNWLLKTGRIKKASTRKDLIEHFGWRVLYSDAAWHNIYPNTDLTLEEGIEIATELNDPEEQLGVLEHVLKLNQQRRANKEEVYARRDLAQVLGRNSEIELMENTLRRVAPGSKLAGLIGTELQLAQEHREMRRRKAN